MTHGITINISDLASSRSTSTPPASGAVDQKADSHPHTANPVRETSKVVIAVYQFFSHNNAAAEAKAQAAVDRLPIVQDESCWKRLFCCGR